MYPLSEPALSVATLTRSWASFLGNADCSDILQKLLHAFWEGELELHHTRKDMLRLLRRKDVSHPGIHFYNPGESNGYEVYPDGSGEIMLNSIRLPEYEEQWVEVDIHEAYTMLAEVMIDEYDPVIRPALLGMLVTFESFRKWCRQNGWTYAKFWNHDLSRQSQDQEKKNSLGEYIYWRIRDAGLTSKEKTREAVLAAYNLQPPKNKVHSIDTRIFKRAWRENATDELKRGGRRSGTLEQL